MKQLDDMSLCNTIGIIITGYPLEILSYIFLELLDYFLNEYFSILIALVSHDDISSYYYIHFYLHFNT